MSQLLGKELPAALQQRLSGGDIEAHEGKIIPIFTIDEAGWAHPALLVLLRDRCQGCLDLGYGTVEG